MKFNIDSQALQGELQILQGVIERKTTIPILSNILVRAKDKKIEFEATDLEVGIRSMTKASVDEEGEITVNARKLYDLVRSLPAMNLTFHLVDGKSLNISGSNVDYKMPVLSTEDYPGVPSTDFKDAFALPAEELSESIAKTIIASAIDDTRYTLNGIFFKINKDGFTLVASDAHRLALCEVEHKIKNLDDEIVFILPRKGAQEISNLLRDKAEESIPLLFKQDGNNLFFQYGKRVLTTRIIEGNYPQYEKVIPQSNYAVEFDRDEIQKIISRIDLVASEKSHAVVLDLKGTQLFVRSSSPEFGEGEEVIDVDYEGENVVAGFNARYLLDFFGVAKKKSIVFKLKDSNTAGMIVEKGNDSYLYVVSPIKL